MNNNLETFGIKIVNKTEEKNDYLNSITVVV
jgi:hypothetical protein